jgi:hypothetical protein
MKRPGPVYYLFAFACAVFAALLVMAGCSRKTAAPSASPTAFAAPLPQAVAAEPAKYVGDEACADCHVREYRAHKKSRHANSLRPADRRSLGSLAPPAGRIPGTPYAITKEGEGFRFGRADNPLYSQRLDIAFGSGKTGLTFVSVVEGEGLMKVRMSYFPRLRRWHVTPQDERLTPQDAPTVLSGEHAYNCLRCHVTTFSPDSFVPERRFYSVGCEGCHGPGSAHVAAASVPGNRDLRMERMSAWGAARIVQMCGRCHGSEASRDGKPSIAVRAAQLRQADGLTHSRCFRESGDRLSCLNCHDPHTDARADVEWYETACLKCHSAAPSTSATSAPQRICPVQPNGRCLSCHMRASKVLAESSIPTVMTDHCIRRRQP